MERVAGHFVDFAAIPLGSVVVDVGAHRGAFGLALWARLRCPLHLYEPDPSFAALLEGEVAALPPGGPVPSVHRLAVWDRRGTLPFYRHAMCDGEASGLLLPRAPPLEVVRVEVVPLVEVLRPHAAIGYLKLDCEGAEVAALLSCPHAGLQRCSTIGVEFHEHLPHLRRRPDARDRAACVDRLRAAGFRVAAEEDHEMLFSSA